ncbi:MAG: hypothetical protein QGH83_01940 [Candidatus Pacebacteria bacterium]|nr:hypothetical protein [Candidatus Paceibacterota bacterium]|tara:strand:- start:1178 stop:1465 length:288 start_codon:yes stop_codon:yes gene_type:complete
MTDEVKNRVLTLHFAYKNAEGWYPFTTAIIKDGDAIERDIADTWMNDIVGRKIAGDPDVISFYISDDLEEVTLTLMDKKDNIIKFVHKTDKGPVA